MIQILCHRSKLFVATPQGPQTPNMPCRKCICWPLATCVCPVAMMDRQILNNNQICSGKFVVVIGVCQHPFILDLTVFLRTLSYLPSTRSRVMSAPSNSWPKWPAMATITATKATQMLLLHISQLLALVGVFSGQIAINPKPECFGHFGGFPYREMVRHPLWDPPTKPPFGVTSAGVAISCPVISG